MTSNIEAFTQSSIRIKGSIGTVYVDSFSMGSELKDADVFEANVKEPVKVEKKDNEKISTEDYYDIWIYQSK